MNILDMTTKKQRRAFIASTLILCITAGIFIGRAVKDNSDKKEGTIHTIAELMEQTVVYQKEEIKLGDWFKKYEFLPIKYTTLDLNGDWTSEMVICLAKGPNGENADVGSLILHNEVDTVYAHILFHREFSQLKSDGTFFFSSSVSNGGIGKIDFSGASYTVKEIAGRKSEDNQTLFYYIDDQAVSKVEYDTYIAKQEQKPESVWKFFDS